jgi:chromosome partitioning protein
MLKTIPVINNKGGVGKTTTAVNLAAGLADRGRDVLLVDLDSQGSASVSLGIDHDDLSPSSADVLFGDRSVEEVIRSTSRSRLDLITGSLELANSDVRLKEQKEGQHRLKQVLSSIEDRYQTIIVDCAPSTSILSVNALVAADAFIIPVCPSYLALEGVVSLGEVVREVRKGMGEAAPILGLVLTMVGTGEVDEEETNSALRDHYGGKVFDTEIRRDPKLEEAPSRSQDIFKYAADSQGALDYGKLIDEVEERLHRYGSVYGDLLNNKAGNGKKASNGETPSNQTQSTNTQVSG